MYHNYYDNTSINYIHKKQAWYQPLQLTHSHDRATSPPLHLIQQYFVLHSLLQDPVIM